MSYELKFKEFERRCKELAKLIKENPKIKNIYGVPKGGLIPAVRISYLANKPITFMPHLNHTAIIDDCIDSGATRHSFDNFTYFYCLVDKKFESIKEWINFWWREK